jgi:hypothetical protein
LSVALLGIANCQMGCGDENVVDVHDASADHDASIGNRAASTNHAATPVGDGSTEGDGAALDPKAIPGGLADAQVVGPSGEAVRALEVLFALLVLNPNHIGQGRRGFRSGR